MKKLMFTAAVAAAGGLMAIESANTVGFTTADVPKGEFGQLAVQFEKTGGGNATVDQLFKGEITGVEAEFDSNFEVTSESQQRAAQIQVWTGSKYNFYYYFSNAWDPTLDNGNGGEVAAWADGLFGEVATDPIAPGQSVWVKATTANTHIVQAGQVYEGSYEKSCPKGEFIMIANTMPTELDLNDSAQIEFSGLTAVAADFDSNYEVTSESQQSAAQIQVWTGSKYVFYYYFSNAWDPTLDNGNGGEVTAWADGLFGEVVTDKIPVGQGFWLKATTSATTVTVNK